MLIIAAILGIIEGLTEFLPVSSTGHLILFGELLGFEGPEGKTFEIVIQLGAILAICWLYRAKLFTTARGLVRLNRPDISFASGIIMAFIPAMILGGLFGSYIKEHLFNPVNVSVALIIGGFIILLVECFRPAVKFKSLDEMPVRLCVKIGMCQCLALIPGTSRSGVTIIGAMLMGVDRKAAAEFSFFLAIPTMFAATFFQIYSSWDSLSMDGLEIIAVGFVTAFISAMLVVRWALGLIETYGFAPFAYYRIILGAVMLFIFYAR
jgi:undecaprenyl-diphosphatase